MLDVHASDYGRTWTALERRWAGLLQELTQVERDMATLRQAAEVIACYLGVPADAEPVPDLLPIAAEGLHEQPAAITLALPAPSSTKLPARSARLPTRREPADQAIVAARAAMLGPPRDDARIPPKVDGKRRRLILADVPQGEAVREAYDRLAEISARAAPEKEPGGRHRLSSRGLIAGEPLVPGLLAVLRAAGRPGDLGLRDSRPPAMRPPAGKCGTLRRGQPGLGLPRRGGQEEARDPDPRPA